MVTVYIKVNLFYSAFFCRSTVSTLALSLRCLINITRKNNYGGDDYAYCRQLGLLQAEEYGLIVPPDKHDDLADGITDDVIEKYIPGFTLFRNVQRIPNNNTSISAS